ncbi:mitochondrial genome maintenance exonuclease 1 [Plakobranchus ocellatus]|uniref:Mitochondrial genome maintenance exonuclease 1 n=1 Tax=Plakobranchus ocellatus TaxID=259542 RepID=A0AAV4CRN8_9GAST|nr:mitochondrial genome maintenance exonuclease 1 [Plakobranchus ocellatus]
MTTVRLCRHVIFLQHLETRTFHLNCKLGKKQYEYDLDNLVKWKQETKLLFGPHRKPTKTGKLKKRIKELDKKLQENVEMLSCLSSSNNAYLSDEDQVHSYSKSKSTSLDAALHSKDVTRPKSSDEVHFYEEKIFWEEESTRQVSQGNGIDDRCNKNNRRKLSSAEKAKKKLSGSLASDQKLDISSPSNANAIERSGALHNNKDKFKSCQEFSADGGEHEEIDIPKLEPLPQKEDLSSTKKVLLPSMADPPIDVPSSFNIVFSFPLAPQGCKTWPDEGGANYLSSFKVDIEQMALRMLPSVKTVLNKTMSDLNRFFLNRWRENMINELGEEGFQKYKNDTLRQGINLHANIMEHLRGKKRSDLQIMPENEGHWSSLHTALQSVSDIRALEMDVFHPALLYRGVFDCMARYKDLLCIIDWKVSKKPRPLLKNTYDDPLQVAAYVGALNATEDNVKQYGEINHGLIVVAYPDGSPAHMHMLNRSQIEQYWQEWTTRLHSFYTLLYTEKLAAKQQAKVGTKT